MLPLFPLGEARHLFLYTMCIEIYTFEENWKSCTKGYIQTEEESHPFHPPERSIY